MKEDIVLNKNNDMFIEVYVVYIDKLRRIY